MVADGKRCDESISRSLKGAAITNSLSCRHPLQQCNARIQRDHRQEFMKLIRVRQHVAPQTVKHAARPHHVSPRRWLTKDGRRISQMLVSWPVTSIVQ